MLSETVIVKCCRCSYQLDVQPLDIRLGSRTFCPNCKTEILLSDEMVMTVYLLVVQAAYEGWDVLGVYSTEGLADEASQRVRPGPTDEVFIYAVVVDRPPESGQIRATKERFA